MGTRALVILEDGYECRGIYCNMDGYPENLGLGLVLGYEDAKRAHKLIEVGAIGGIRFNIENAKLSHRVFDPSDCDMKTFVMMPSAFPSDPKNLNEVLKRKIRRYFAEFVYWGRVCDRRSKVNDTHKKVVEWTCLDVANGEFVDLKEINPMDFIGTAYRVKQSPLGWQYDIFGTGTKGTVSEYTVYCDSEDECYAKIGDLEYAPERDAVRGKDRK